MRIRIFGPCGSGKSYFARKLSHALQIPMYETDNMIWDRTLNEKYSRNDRQINLVKVLNRKPWIIEGAQYRWSFDSFEAADLIIVVEPNLMKLFFRVTLRFFKMHLGLEKHHYKQSFKELYEMYVQSDAYYKESKNDFKEKINHLNSKVIIINDSKLTETILETITNTFVRDTPYKTDDTRIPTK